MKYFLFHYFRSIVDQFLFCCLFVDLFSALPTPCCFITVLFFILLIFFFMKQQRKIKSRRVNDLQFEHIWFQIFRWHVIRKHLERIIIGLLISSVGVCGRIHCCAIMSEKRKKTKLIAFPLKGNGITWFIFKIESWKEWIRTSACVCGFQKPWPWQKVEKKKQF